MFEFLQVPSALFLVFGQAVEVITPSSPLWQHLLAVAVFSLVGVIILAVCIYLMELLTPFSIVKEIIDEHNLALAVLMSSIVIGVSLIIAAAVTG